MMPLSVLGSLPVLVATIVVALVALVVMAIGLRGRMVPRRARCAKCEHDLHDPMPACCGECGADLTHRDGVEWGRPVPRAGICAIGSVLLLVTIVATAVVVAVRGSTDNIAYSAASILATTPDELRARIVAAAPTDPIWSAATMAIEDGLLDRARMIALFEGAAERLQSQSRQRDRSVLLINTSSLIAGLLHHGEIVGTLDEPTRVELVRRLVDDLSVAMPTLVQSGQPFFVIPRASLLSVADFMPDLDLRFEVRRVAVDDAALAPAQMSGRQSPAVASSPLTVVRAPPLDARTDLANGAAESKEVDVEVDVAIIITPQPTGLFRPVLVVPSPPLEVVLPTITRRIEIVPETEPLPRGVRSPQLRAAALETIEVERVGLMWDLDGENLVAFAAMSLTPIAGAAISFDATLVVDADPPIEIALGVLAAESRETESFRMHGFGGHASMRRHRPLTGWAPSVPPEAIGARLVFAPRLAPFIQHFGADRWLDEEIIFDDLRLERRDLDTDARAVERERVR